MKPIKTFEEFTKAKPIYKPVEFGLVYDIVSQYYDDKGIENFIESPDVETKTEFIEDNEIVNLRVCQNCGKFITEGYLYKDIETYCSDKCFIEDNSQSIFDNADEDVLYWTAWEG